MTTRKLSSERLLDDRLIGNMTRRRMPHVLVAFLIHFFTTSVPLMMARREFSDVLYTRAQVLDHAEFAVRRILSVNLVFMFILGIYFGVVTMHYMMRRRSAQFWHALPQRRETLYFSSLISALLSAALGALVNLLVLLVLFSVYSLFTAAVMRLFLLLLFKNVVYFLASYAVTVFAGSFSGSSVVQVLMSLIVQFYPLAAFCGIAMLRDMYAVYYDLQYYMSERILPWLSPAAYAASHYYDGISALSLVCAFLAIAALLLGAAVIYRRRAMENAEKTIVFKRLGTIVKYMILFVITVYAGLFFYAITDSTGLFWTIFGFGSGALLGFMLLNTILYKTPKAMFRGFRGLAVFVLVFALYFIVFGADVFKMDEFVPDADALSYAEIAVNSAPFDDRRFDDPKMLDTLSALLENTVEFDAEDLVNPYDYGDAAFQLSVVMHTKLGIPIARTYFISKAVPGALSFLEQYANDQRMDEMLYEMDPLLEQYGKQTLRAHFSVRLDGNYIDFDAPIYEFMALYRTELGTLDYSRLRSLSVGQAELYSPYIPVADATNTLPVSSAGLSAAFRQLQMTAFPLYADMERTLAWLHTQASFGEDGAAEASTESRICGGLLLDTSVLVPAAREVGRDDGDVNEVERYCRYYSSTVLSAAQAERLYVEYGAATRSGYGLSSDFIAIDTMQLLVVFWDNDLPETDEAVYSEEVYLADTASAVCSEFVFIPLSPR